MIADHPIEGHYYSYHIRGDRSLLRFQFRYSAFNELESDDS